MKKNVGIIIENDKGEILLQQRDDKVKLFPFCWTLFGGAMEEDESPEDAVKREIKEEIGLDISGFTHFNNFQFGSIFQYIFYKNLNLDLSKINLNEGKDIRFFSFNEIKDLKLAFNMKEIIDKFKKEIDST